ncbi:alpha/beta fold hydrolase [Stackebrandtia soli]|uniref:alpha/beta fold hydrolase n=1 Tax=Stackebrandtia soli TaxID=1892856 RepID=UPI0039EAED12
MTELPLIGGVPTWYAVNGAGEPVVLLHGGLVDSRSFERAVTLLSPRYRVFTVDRRGHGRTPDMDGPYSYELLADDTIAFLEQVVEGSAHLVGFSDGANIALIVAARRPDLVRRLVTISGNFHHDGLLPGVLDGFADDRSIQRLASRHGEVSPDGAEHFDVVAAKDLAMARSGPTLTTTELAFIAVPTLVMAADDDVMPLEHTVALYRAIPDAALAIVPRTSHLLIMERPVEVYTIVDDFLSRERPIVLSPVRRAPHRNR